MAVDLIRKTDWQSDYSKKLCSAADAVSLVMSDQKIYMHSNAAAPQVLIAELVRQSNRLERVKIFQLLTLGNADYALEEHQNSFEVNAFFIGGNTRVAINSGRGQYLPVSLSEIPSLFNSNELAMDVCMLQLSPPDQHGFCSYGVSVDCSIAARKNAKIVIAEVNKQMPRALGRSFIHVSRLDRIVETDYALPELRSKKISHENHCIGANVAELVDDEATLQLGIGEIPNAVLANLVGKKNLGVHSEMFSDGVVDLIEAGIITNDAKTLLPGKAAVSFVMGTQRLYNFVDNNPLIEFQTSDFINDPSIIAQNFKMTAVNSALQIDLTGQVAADSIGGYLYSGFGGQLDFFRGASKAKNGKAILAMPSTARNGNISRISVSLPTGAGVVTSRADVHYVVTEYGVAQLYGKTLRQRAKSLVAIAHPKFREQLAFDCKKFPWF